MYDDDVSRTVFIETDWGKKSKKASAETGAVTVLYYCTLQPSELQYSTVQYST
jgi:hypothetical protein